MRRRVLIRGRMPIHYFLDAISVRPQHSELPVLSLLQALCSSHARECEEHCKEEVTAAEGGKKGSASSRASKQAIETCKWRCTLSTGSPCLAVRRMLVCASAHARTCHPLEAGSRRTLLSLAHAAC